MMSFQDETAIISDRIAQQELEIEKVYLQRTAEGTVDAIFKEIEEFEKGIPKDHAVAIHVGQIGPVILEEIYSNGPLLVVFRGRSKSGSVVIVQHLSQVSITMIAMKSDQPRKPIGFRG